MGSSKSHPSYSTSTKAITLSIDVGVAKLSHKSPKSSSRSKFKGHQAILECSSLFAIKYKGIKCWRSWQRKRRKWKFWNRKSNNGRRKEKKALKMLNMKSLINTPIGVTTKTAKVVNLMNELFFLMWGLKLNRGSCLIEFRQWVVALIWERKY